MITINVWVAILEVICELPLTFTNSTTLRWRKCPILISWCWDARQSWFSDVVSSITSWWVSHTCFLNRASSTARSKDVWRWTSSADLIVDDTASLTSIRRRPSGECIIVTISIGSGIVECCKLIGIAVRWGCGDIRIVQLKVEELVRGYICWSTTFATIVAITRVLAGLWRPSWTIVTWLIWTTAFQKYCKCCGIWTIIHNLITIVCFNAQSFDSVFIEPGANIGTSIRAAPSIRREGYRWTQVLSLELNWQAFSFCSTCCLAKHNIISRTSHRCCTSTRWDSWWWGLLIDIVGDLGRNPAIGWRKINILSVCGVPCITSVPISLCVIVATTGGSLKIVFAYAEFSIWTKINGCLRSR